MDELMRACGFKTSHMACKQTTSYENCNQSTNASLPFLPAWGKRSIELQLQGRHTASHSLVAFVDELLAEVAVDLQGGHAVMCGQGAVDELAELGVKTDKEAFAEGAMAMLGNAMSEDEETNLGGVMVEDDGGGEGFPSCGEKEVRGRVGKPPQAACWGAPRAEQFSGSPKTKKHLREGEGGRGKGRKRQEGG
ncbi:hypothetical protein FQN60_013341 [Etheostoma spectabile]|uniref:Uncharacterized protein n=1 Tax=Etheostoma spectabile TaxID=54343 RepID=A0A5J5DBC8_9PERO|nr:hypothetical protein FQN60_013341 [Etheostoma spectabile]